MLHPFYPIIDNANWLPRILPLGVKLVQLRLKNLSQEEIVQQVKESTDLCSRARATLIINDHWQEAIDAKADYVHLGQEDLVDADLKALRKSGISFGLSTHNEEELETALATNPDYIAIGPIFETQSKNTGFKPAGLKMVRQWRGKTKLPLVAIGGITLQNAKDVFHAGADSICIIGDVFNHANPEKRTTEWLNAASTW